MGFIKRLIDQSQKKQINLLKFMLANKNSEIYNLKQESDKLTKLANSLYTEKTTYKEQVDSYQQTIAEKDMLIHSLQNPDEK